MRLEQHMSLWCILWHFTTAPRSVRCLHPVLTCFRLVQDAKNWYQRNKAEEGGGGYLGYGWDSAIWGVDVQLAYLTNNSAPLWAAEVRWAFPALSTKTARMGLV